MQILHVLRMEKLSSPAKKWECFNWHSFVCESDRMCDVIFPDIPDNWHPTELDSEFYPKIKVTVEVNKISSFSDYKHKTFNEYPSKIEIRYYAEIR